MNNSVVRVWPVCTELGRGINMNMNATTERSQEERSEEERLHPAEQFL